MLILGQNDLGFKAINSWVTMVTEDLVISSGEHQRARQPSVYHSRPNSTVSIFTVPGAIQKFVDKCNKTHTYHRICLKINEYIF